MLDGDSVMVQTGYIMLTPYHVNENLTPCHVGLVNREERAIAITAVAVFPQSPFRAHA